MSCCNHKKYDAAFDAKLAQTELDAYLTTGLKESSRPIFETLQTLPLKGHTLLDIGGGIGAVTFELLGKGIRQATHVDISKAYVDIFREEAERRSLEGKVESLHGNFPDIQTHIPHADLVMLDKVICCYDDYEGLVSASVSKARRWYIYSIPRNVWWVRIRLCVDEMIDRIKGRYLPIYFHPIAGIERIIASAGLHKKEVKLQGWWRIALFEKEQ